MPRRTFLARLSGLLLSAPLLASPLLAQQNWVPGHPYLVVETGQRYNRLQDAIFAIGEGKGTIRIDPGQWDDCGVQVAGDITFQAAVPGQTRFVGPRVCESKAALVLRGRNSRVEGFIFANFHLNDGNAAGIRLEKGNLTAVQNWFKDSDEGILTSNDPNGTVVVDRSTFTRLGRCGGYAPCAHAIYINHYGQATVTRSRFEAGLGGHYLKSRAAHVTATDNVFDDSAGRGTNYLIDLPSGATGTIERNLLIQGPNKENPTTLIAVAAEEHAHSSAGLVVRDNTARLAPGATSRPAFVADWSGERLAIGVNRLGEGITPFSRR